MSEETALAVRELTPTILDMFTRLDIAGFESRKYGVSKGELVLRFLFCYEQGLPLSTAFNGIYVVKGRIGIESVVVAAQLRRHPNYDYDIKQLDNDGCTIEVTRHGEAIGEVSFTMDDARLAGLDKKETYKMYPADLLYGRAMSRAYKRYAPDIFSQPVYVREELDALDDKAVNTTWEVVEDTPTSDAPAAATEVVGVVVTLDDLLKEYEAEAILVANEGRVPATLEEVQEVAERLGA